MLEVKVAVRLAEAELWKVQNADGALQVQRGG
jgi:hypothetical protein